MGWGVCFGPAWGASVAELVAPAREAERRGFDRIAVGEYHNDALTWLHALVAATTRVPVATTIVNVHLRHPAVVAESVAAIRDLHGDRVELGLGISHRAIVERDLGIGFDGGLGGLDYLEEYGRAVRQLQLGLPFTGERLRAEPPLRRARLRPGTAPLLVAALGERAVERASTYADGVVLTWTPPAWTARLASRLRGAARRGPGSAPGPGRWRVMVVVPCFPDPDPGAALQASRAALYQYLLLPSYRRMLVAAGHGDAVRAALDAGPGALPEALVRQVAAVGDRSEVERLAAAYRDAGVTDLVLYPLPVRAGWGEALQMVLEDCAPGQSGVATRP
jgi:5,10-methylenetetrahydromethanopterin reductase